MTVKRTLWTFLLVLVFGTALLWAGDTATFVDLGFSADGRTYAFAQYGIQSRTLRPWAELFVVDVPRNNFVNGGRLSFVHDIPVVAGQDGSGAFYRLLTQNNALLSRHGVNFLLQGQPLFISLEEPNSPPRQTVEFRDFQRNISYRATIVPRTEGSGSNMTSSFHIDLERTNPDGSRRSYVVGTPSVRRPQVISYRIRQVIIAPQDGSMIMIIEMRRQNGPDFDVRFMVEALRL